MTSKHRWCLKKLPFGLKHTLINDRVEQQQQQQVTWARIGRVGALLGRQSLLMVKLKLHSCLSPGMYASPLSPLHALQSAALKCGQLLVIAFNSTILLFCYLVDLPVGNCFLS